MPVTIPNDKNKPNPPVFRISGEQIISENPPTSTTLSNYRVPTWVAKNGSNFTAQEPILMSQSVDITIADPDGISVRTYNTNADFVGGAPFTGRTIGNNLEIYYTLNGKDPIRTKAYLYTGSFSIALNRSGSDNTIIKARSYYKGLWSDVSKIELRIADDITATNVDPSV